jgi:hypothetical protein
MICQFYLAWEMNFCSIVDKNYNETDNVANMLAFICIDEYHLIYKRQVFKIFYKKEMVRFFRANIPIQIDFMYWLVFVIFIYQERRCRTKQLFRLLQFSWTKSNFKQLMYLELVCYRYPYSDYFLVN